MKSLLFKIPCIIISIVMVQITFTHGVYCQVGLPTDGGINGAHCITYSVVFDAFIPASTVTPNSNGEATNGDVGVDISGNDNSNIDVSMILPTNLVGTDGKLMPIIFPSSGPGGGVHVETGGFFNPNVTNTFNLGSGGTCNLRLGYTVIVPTNSGEAFTGQIITTINGTINVTTTITVYSVGCGTECLGNIVTNGTFTEGLVPGQMPPEGSATVANWTAAYRHPTVSGGMGCVDTGLIGMWGNRAYGEAIQQTLLIPIIKGKTYRATICYAWALDPNKLDYIRFRLRASNYNLTGTTGGTTIGVTPDNSSSWRTETLPDWMADSNYTILTIGPENNSNTQQPDLTSWGYIDNVCIQVVDKPTTGPPVSHVQRWYIPTAPNIQGLTIEEPPGKLPMNAWFTEMDQEKLGRLQMPKLYSDCNFANLNEWELHWIDSLIPARPFKIAYYNSIKLPKPYNDKIEVWYSDTNRNTINGISLNKKRTYSTVYSYKIDSTPIHPWDIQVQGKVHYTYVNYQNNKKVSLKSNPKVWFTIHPRTNQIFAIDPYSPTAVLETYTLPYGKVDAFFIDAVLPNSVEHIWIAASESSYTYYYRMPVLGGNSLMWKLPDSISNVNSIRTLFQSKKLNTKDQLPNQLWALGNTSDGLGEVRILQFNTNVVNSTVNDLSCTIPRGYYNGPNGLFTPSSKASINVNRMFITDGFADKDTLSSNRATPTDSVRRQLVVINKTTRAIHPVLKSVNITSRRVKPLCEVLNWKFSIASCVVDQWKAYEPPPSFDFSTAYLDIDMIGNYTLIKGSASKNKPDMEQYNFAFHEPRPGDFGIVGRITYTAGNAINGVICDTCTIPIQHLDEFGNELPNEFQLFNAYPNPFNPTTTLKFALPTASRVLLKVYNMLGQEVHTLFDAEEIDAGYKEVTFNASNLASGVYYYRLIAQPLETDGKIDATFTDIKKMLMIK